METRGASIYRQIEILADENCRAEASRDQLYRNVRVFGDPTSPIPARLPPIKLLSAPGRVYRAATRIVSAGQETVKTNRRASRAISKNRAKSLPIRPRNERVRVRATRVISEARLVERYCASFSMGAYYAEADACINTSSSRNDHSQHAHSRGALK